MIEYAIVIGLMCFCCVECFFGECVLHYPLSCSIVRSHFIRDCSDPWSNLSGNHRTNGNRAFVLAGVLPLFFKGVFSFFGLRVAIMSIPVLC